MGSEGSFLLGCRTGLLLCLFVYSVNGRALLEVENSAVIVKNPAGAKAGTPTGLASTDCTIDADFNPVLNGAFLTMFFVKIVMYVFIMISYFSSGEIAQNVRKGISPQ
jgi:hypothetical protein